MIITNHRALNYDLNKPHVAHWAWHWLLLFQEFDFDVMLCTDKSHLMANRLSRIESNEATIGIDDHLPDSTLFLAEASED